ncbi:hypothetical protein Tco_0110458 [Tanacetum coccineum]
MCTQLSLPYLGSRVLTRLTCQSEPCICNDKMSEAATWQAVIGQSSPCASHTHHDIKEVNGDLNKVKDKIGESDGKMDENREKGLNNDTESGNVDTKLNKDVNKVVSDPTQVNDDDNCNKSMPMYNIVFGSVDVNLCKNVNEENVKSSYANILGSNLTKDDDQLFYVPTSTNNRGCWCNIN